MNPFDLPGPEFLWFYGVLLGVAVGAAFLLRDLLRQPSHEAEESIELSPYELAYLAGGEQHVFAVVLAKLIRAGAIGVDGQERRVRLSGKQQGSDGPLEVGLISAIDCEAGTLLNDLRPCVAPFMGQIRSRLQSQGLLVAPDQAFLVGCLPAILVGAVVLLGAIKICIGASADKPVGWLCYLIYVAGWVAFAFFACQVHRSQRGDRVLTRLQERHTSLETCLRSNPDSLFGADLTLAIALFGLGIVTSGPLADLKTAMQVPSGSGAGSDSGGDGGGCGGGCGGCGG